MSNSMNLSQSVQYSPTRGSHKRQLRIKEDIPKDNIKREKVIVPPAKVYQHDFMKLPAGLTNRYNFVDLNDYMTESYAHGKYITMPTLNPNREGKVYKLKLRLKCETDPDQRICVVGSLPELGYW